MGGAELRLLVEAAFGARPVPRALVVLLLALTYGLAGVHFHTAFFVPAVLFTIGFGVLLWLDSWPWTVVGVLSAIGLLFTGWYGSARDAVKAA